MRTGRVRPTVPKAGVTRARRRYESGGKVQKGNSYKCGGKIKRK